MSSLKPLIGIEPEDPKEMNGNPLKHLLNNCNMNSELVSGKNRLNSSDSVLNDLNRNKFEDANNNNSVKVLKNGSIKTHKKEVEKKSDEDKKGGIRYGLFGFKADAPLKWHNVIAITLAHIAMVMGFLYPRPIMIRIYSVIWGFVVGGVAGFGVTAGVHRMWTHRAYKAKLPLRIILAACFSVSGQNTIYDWVRDHRVHHKYSETSADPHDSNRGFFFAHVGWLMMNKHPEVIRKGNQIDMSDVTNDPVVKYHQMFFIPLKILLCFVIPTVVPVYFWNEQLYWAFMSQCVIRYMFSLNFTWLVNSAAHIWGKRPYDNRIRPAENIAVSIVAMGEGWHNYHHVFPWDYKAAELGNYFNLTTFWIHLFEKIGWAYDLKQPTNDLIEKTIKKYGDGSHYEFGHHMSEIPDPEFS